MTDAEAFLRAIREAPADDVPRLAFADWLAENGQEARGEFVRVQCALAKPWVCEWMTRGLDCERYNADISPWRVMVKCPPCRRRDALRARERELLAAYGKAWLPELLADLRDAYADDIFTYRRGFVATATVSWATWRDHGDAVLAAVPGLERVTLTTWPTYETYADFGIITYQWQVQNRRRPVPKLSDTGPVVVDLLRDSWPAVASWGLPVANDYRHQPMEGVPANRVEWVDLNENAPG